jgi:hypothetical protein
MNAGATGSCAAFAPAGDLTDISVSQNCAAGAGMSAGAGWPVPAGQSAYWMTTAPYGITINSAWTTNGDVAGNGLVLGWKVNDMWRDNTSGQWGGSWLAPGQGWFNTAAEGTPNINSSVYGIRLVCTNSPSQGPCSGQTIPNFVVTGIELAGTENQGPSINAIGTNLWNETGPYVRGAGWPISFSSADPSGVCEMWAVVDGAQILGPTSSPDHTVWHQCPDQSWYQAIDTRTYEASSGTISLELDALNAAGVTSTTSETLKVDNDPVTVRLAPDNDADPNVWVNHAVSVTAHATAGASGVGGVQCSVDRQSANGYSGPVIVDGDGSHSLTCTGWNNAIDPTGAVATGNSSVAIKIDEAPPTIDFEPEDPSSPTDVVANTSDSESGVASGSLAIAPTGTDAWTNLPTGFDGQHLLGSFDDAGLHGPYTVRASACDNAGNCASTDENLTLPLRVAAVSDVSFQKIANPLHAKKARERVRVGWHWALVRRGGRFVRVKRGGHYRRIAVVRMVGRCSRQRVRAGHRHRIRKTCRMEPRRVIKRVRVGAHWVRVRRGGRLVRVKRGGHYRRITVVRWVERCTRRRVRTGRHRWALRKRCVAPRVKVMSSERVGFGRRVTVHGLVLSAQGVPISGVPVSVQTAPENGLDRYAPAATVSTDANGAWSAILPAGPSRVMRAVYGGSATVLPAAGQASVSVRAQIRMSIRPRVVPWNGEVTIGGRLLGGYVPADGLALRLLIWLHGRQHPYSPLPFRTNARGAFTLHWSFATGAGVASYPFSVAMTGPESDYPFAAGSSRKLMVTFGLNTPNQPTVKHKRHKAGHHTSRKRRKHARHAHRRTSAPAQHKPAHHPHRAKRRHSHHGRKT